MPFYGKYRAKVVSVDDPQKRGRIRVLCPKVLGTATSAWCEPCIPVAYDKGGDFALPLVDEFVWVEFEAGDPNKPIYTGGLWSESNSPSKDYASGTRLITWGDCKIVMTKDTIDFQAPNVKINGKSPAAKGDKAVAYNVSGTVSDTTATIGTVTSTIQ